MFDFFKYPLCYYVCIVMYAYVSCLEDFEESFCGLHCPNVLVVLAGGGTWRCDHTLFGFIY